MAPQVTTDPSSFRAEKALALFVEKIERSLKLEARGEEIRFIKAPQNISNYIKNYAI
jgi:hypothetical protein